MNPEVKADWLTALRSGKYKQGRGYLHAGDRYCCLGVLCDLAAEAGIVGEAERSPTGDLFTYADGTFLADQELPESVLAWAGIESESGADIGAVEIVDDGYDDGSLFMGESLAEINDSGMTFSAIADIIEERL